MLVGRPRLLRRLAAGAVLYVGLCACAQLGDLAFAVPAPPAALPGGTVVWRGEPALPMAATRSEALSAGAAPGGAGLLWCAVACLALVGVQRAAPLEWKHKAARTASFVGVAGGSGRRALRTGRQHGYDDVPAPAFFYDKAERSYADLPYTNDVGYLPDGTPMNRAGNAVNHPESIGPDPHVAGSPLPRAVFVNDVGYLPDGTPMNRAGNAINHPESVGPDPHRSGSPLPAPLKGYVNDVGYCPDGTPMARAGNMSVRK